MEDKRIIEIGGVKVEVDLRTAKVIETYRVGQRVKVLKKDYSGYTVYPGIIVGLDDFKDLPTLTIAYIEKSYSTADIHLLYLNSKTEDTEIAPMIDDEFLVDKDDCYNVFERQITVKQRELDDLKQKRDYVISRFGELFTWKKA